MIPTPPCCASAMARWDSVTVSIAELTMGIFKPIFRVSQVRVSVCAGTTSLRAGSSKTSSKVRPSGIVSGIMRGVFMIAPARRDPLDVRRALLDAHNAFAVRLSELFERQSVPPQFCRHVLLHQARGVIVHRQSIARRRDLHARDSVSSAHIVHLFQILVSQGPEQIVMQSYFRHSLVKDTNAPGRDPSRNSRSLQSNRAIRIRDCCAIVKTVKRKRPLPDAAATSDAIVPEVILERARRTIEAERFKKPQACVICGGECAPNSTEGL